MEVNGLIRDKQELEQRLKNEVASLEIQKDFITRQAEEIDAKAGKDRKKLEADFARRAEEFEADAAAREGAVKKKERELEKKYSEQMEANQDAFRDQTRKLEREQAKFERFYGGAKLRGFPPGGETGACIDFSGNLDLFLARMNFNAEIIAS